MENHLTLDPGKISVIYTRPSLIVNSSSSSSSFSSLFNPFFYETLFYDSDNFNRARFHHTEYILNAEENINSTRSFSLFYFSFFLLLRYLLTSSPNATRRFLLKIMLAGFKNMSFCSTQKYIVLFARNCTPTLYIYSTTCLIKQPVKKIINSKFYSDESSLLIFVLNSSQYFFFFFFFFYIYTRKDIKYTKMEMCYDIRIIKEISI